MTRDELAKAIVKLPGWRWLPGMLAVDTGLRLDEMTADWDARMPDLTDPATGGCMLVMLSRELDAVATIAGPEYAHIQAADDLGGIHEACGPSVGVACARVALALGRWPGGGS